MEKIYLKQLVVFEEFIKQLAKKNETSVAYNKYARQQVSHLYDKIKKWNDELKDEQEEKPKVPSLSTLLGYFYTYREDSAKYNLLKYSQKYVNTLAVFLDYIDHDDIKSKKRDRYLDFNGFCNQIKKELGYDDVDTDDLIYYKNNTKGIRKKNESTSTSKTSIIGKQFEEAGSDEKKQNDKKKIINFGNQYVSIENKNDNIIIQLYRVEGKDTILEYIDPDFKAKLSQLLNDNTESIREIHKAIKDLQPLISLTTIERKYTIKKPPEFWEVSPYTLTDNFIGREREIERLNNWADSDIPVMVLEGIGGLGKSAIAYEWINQYKNNEIYGKLWWSFYDHPSLEEFVRYTLAYLTRQTPTSISGSYRHNAEQLRIELNKQPSILILDGLERILVAYHRWDKAQQRDDQIDDELRYCTNPLDDIILNHFTRVSPSKILITSRLIPFSFQDDSGELMIPGADFHALEGFSKLDTIKYFEAKRIYGNKRSILGFCRKFGFHGLVIKIVCSSIKCYPPKPRSFDYWLKDPMYGGSLKLSEMDIRDKHANKSKILEFALRGLDKNISLLLSRIAILPENIDYEIIEKINPFEPDVVQKPFHIKDSIRWKYLWEDKFKKRVLSQFDAKYKRELSEYVAYTKIKEQAIPNLHNAINELVDRDLIKWDRSGEDSYFNMHPVVRGHAKDINLSDNKNTYKKAKDYFSAIPEIVKTEKITDLSQIINQLMLVHAAIGAEQYEDTLEFYKKHLHPVLTTQLYNFSRQVEYLNALFKDGELRINSSLEKEWVYRNLAYALDHTGNTTQALYMIQQSIQINIENEKWVELSNSLSKLININTSLNNIYVCHAVAELRYELCKSANLKDINNASRFLACTEIMRGNFKKSNQFFIEQRDSIDKDANAMFWKWINQYYQGKPSEKIYKEAYQVAINHRDLLSQMYCLREFASWKMRLGEPILASETIDKAIYLMHMMGEYSPKSYGIKAWALAQLDRKEEAKNQLLLIDEKDQLYYAARAWWLIGDEVKAQQSAIREYKRAWSCGPPYTYYTSLKSVEKFIKKRGWKTPELPSFDKKIGEIPFQKEIQSAINHLTANTKKKKD